MVRWRWPSVALTLCMVAPIVASRGVAQAAPPPPKPVDAPPPAFPVPEAPSGPVAPAETGAKPGDNPAAAKATPAATDAVVLDPTALDSIIGRSVKSLTGEDMGRVVDTLVMPTGQVRAVVIDFGGFLGVGTRRIAVDWKALDFKDVAKSGNVNVALTRNQVRMAPEYKQGDPIVLLEATTPEPAKAAASPAPAPKTDAPAKDSPTVAAPPPATLPPDSPKKNN